MLTRAITNLKTDWTNRPNLSLTGQWPKFWVKFNIIIISYISVAPYYGYSKVLYKTISQKCNNTKIDKQDTEKDKKRGVIAFCNTKSVRSRKLPLNTTQ